jgi:hypothetical protein
MTSHFKTRALRSLMLGGSAAAITMSAPASAATLNSGPTFPFIIESGITTCQVRVDYNVTGTATNDAITIAVTNGGALINGGNSGVNLITTNSQSLQNGQTFPLASSFLLQSTLGRAPYAVTIYDPPFGNQFTNPITTVPIPRSLLRSGGAACAALATNVAPINNAGPDQTLGGGGGVVNLPGTANDGDGDPLTHAWSQLSGPAVTLTGANTLNPSFTAPAQTNQARTLVFRVITADGIAPPVSDTVSVTIPAGPNTPPVANAGADATINAGATTPLNGSATDLDSDPLTYQWTQTAGPSHQPALARSRH